MIGYTEIKQVSEIKLLGVILDNKLFWDAHVRSIRKNLASLYRMHKPTSIPKHQHKELYYSLFESYLTYCSKKC